MKYYFYIYFVLCYCDLFAQSHTSQELSCGYFVNAIFDEFPCQTENNYNLKFDDDFIVNNWGEFRQSSFDNSKFIEEYISKRHIDTSYNFNHMISLNTVWSKGDYYSDCKALGISVNYRFFPRRFNMPIFLHIGHTLDHRFINRINTSDDGYNSITFLSPEFGIGIAKTKKNFLFSFGTGFHSNIMVDSCKLCYSTFIQDSKINKFPIGWHLQGEIGYRFSKKTYTFVKYNDEKRLNMVLLSRICQLVDTWKHKP